MEHFLSKPLWLCSIPGVLIQLLVLILTTRCSTFFVYSKPTLTPTVPHVQTDTPLPFNLTPLSPLGVSPEPFSQTHLHSNPIRQRKVLPLSQSHHLSPPPPPSLSVPPPHPLSRPVNMMLSLLSITFIFNQASLQPQTCVKLWHQASCWCHWAIQAVCWCHCSADVTVLLFSLF